MGGAMQKRRSPGAINRSSGSCRGEPIWTCEPSAQKLLELDLPGYAIGGLAVGEGFAAMVRVLKATAPLLPADKPRYLMGVGFPRDIVAACGGGDRYVRLHDADAKRPQCLRLHGSGARCG